MTSAITYSLNPYKGVLKKEDLLHLLRRCLFGVGRNELAAFEGKNIEEAMQLLLKQSPETKPPVQQDPDRVDPLVPKGKVWIKAPYEDQFIDKSRRDALKGWIAGQIINRDYSLTEKMTLFWRNHFVTETDVVNDARYSYTYSQMVRSFSLGNFKKLVIEGTTNPAMLVYLNGNTNNKNAPNENYSRELMELFTLGKGETVQYTEEDVRTAAKVLTGWKDNKVNCKGEFHANLHDSSDKQFSSFFGNHIIKGQSGAAGSQEVKDLIEMIFKRKETALFFCRNLYRWFVYHEIDEQAEQEIIKPLAQQFIINNFEVVPVLKTLLSSNHFFDFSFRGCLVKSPADFFIGAIQQFNLVFPSNPYDAHLTWIFIYFDMLGLLMGIADPPSVSGWPAYYQPPKYGQWWINSHTLGFRKIITDGLSSTEGKLCNGPILKFDFLTFIQSFKNPENIDKIIQQSLDLLCAVKVSEPTTRKLKSLLLMGNIKSESQWEKSWLRFITHPDDLANIKDLETGLRFFFKKLMNMPEYQMM